MKDSNRSEFYRRLSKEIDSQTKILSLELSSYTDIPWLGFFKKFGTENLKIAAAEIKEIEKDKLELTGNCSLGKLNCKHITFLFEFNKENVQLKISANTPGITLAWMESHGSFTLPGILSVLKNLETPEGIIYFDSEKNYYEYSFDFSESLKEAIDLFELKLRSPLVRFVTNGGEFKFLALFVKSTFLEGERDFMLTVPLANNQKWKLNLFEGTEADLSFQKITHAIERLTKSNGLQNCFPQALLNRLPSIGIKELEIQAPLALNGFINFKTELIATEPIKLFNNVDLFLPTLKIETELFYGKLNFSASFSGTLFIGTQTNVSVNAVISSDPEEPIQFGLTANIDIAQLVSLENLPLGFKLADLALPKSMLSLNSITVQRMDLAFDIKALKIISTELELTADCDIEIIKGIKLGQPFLSLIYDTDIEEGEPVLTGTFEGRLKIGRTPFYGKAMKNTDGWTIKAYTEKQEPILLKELIKDIAEIGGATIDTDQLPELKIGYTALEFKTKDSSITFKTRLETKIPLPFLLDSNLQTATFIKLSSKKEGNNYNFTWNFVSEFKIGPAIFGVRFEKAEPGKKKFEAGWKAAQKQDAITLESIAKAFGITLELNDLPGILKPKLTEVAFSYDEFERSLALTAYTYKDTDTDTDTQFYIIAKKDTKDKWQFVLGLNYKIEADKKPEDINEDLYNAAKEIKLEQLSLLYAGIELKDFALPVTPRLTSTDEKQLYVKGKKISTKAGVFFAADIKGITLPGIKNLKSDVDQFYIEVSKTVLGTSARVKGQLSLKLPNTDPLLIQAAAAYSATTKAFDFEGSVESKVGLHVFAEAILPDEFKLPHELQLPDITETKLKFNTGTGTFSFDLKTLPEKKNLVIKDFFEAGADSISISKDENGFKFELVKAKLKLHALNDIFENGVGGTFKINIDKITSKFSFEPDGFVITSPAVRYEEVESVNNTTGATKIREKILLAKLQPGPFSIEKDGKKWFIKTSAKFSLEGTPKPLSVIFDEKDGKSAKKFEAIFSINNEGASATIESKTELAGFIIPNLFKQVGDATGLPDIGDSAFTLKSITCTIGKEMTVNIDSGFALPSNLNKALGFEKALFRTFKKGDPDSFVLARLSIGTKGLGGGIIGSPFVKNDFIIINQEKTHIDIDFDKLFGEDSFGKINVQIPTLSLDLKSGSFKFSGGYTLDEKKGLKIPLFPIKQLLKALKLEGVASNLPKSIPVKSTTADQALDAIIAILKGEENKIPKELTNILDSLKSNLKRLPDRFRKYLAINIPNKLSLIIDITADGGVSFDLATDKKNPIQFLFPSLPHLIGIRLSRISFGTAFGGSLFKLELSAELDVFDPITLVGSYILLENNDITKWLAPRKEIRQTIIAEDLVMLIIYQAGFPIPIPLFYSNLGIHSVSLDGSGLVTNISLPKPVFNAMKMLEIIKGAKDFIIKGDDFKVNPYPIKFEDGKDKGEMNLNFSAGPFYLQLPRYIVNEGPDKFKQIGITKSYKLFDALNTTGIVLNGFKHLVMEGSPAYLIKAFPIDMRHGTIHADLLGCIRFDFKWLLSTPLELLEIAKEKPDFFADVNETKYLLANLQRTSPARLPSAAPIGKYGLAETDKGMVAFVRGAFKINDVAEFSVEGGLAWDGKAFGVCYALHGKIAGKKLEMRLQGLLVIRQNYIAVEGNAGLNLLGIQLFRGRYELAPGKFLMEAQVGSELNELPVSFSGKLEGNFSNDLIDVSGHAALRFFALTVNGSCKLVIDGIKPANSLLHLDGKIEIKDFFFVQLHFNASLANSEPQALLKIDAKFLNVLQLKFEGNALINQSQVSVSSQIEVLFLNKQILKAVMVLSNKEITISGNFAFIPALNVNGGISLTRDNFILTGNGELEVGPFKSSAHLTVKANSSEQLFNLDVVNLLGSGATINLKLKNAVGQKLALACSVDKSIRVLNGMLVVTAASDIHKGPKAELVLDTSGIEEFKLDGAVSLLGLRSAGYVEYGSKENKLNYLLSTSWTGSDIFKSAMTLEGTISPDYLSAETKVLMELDIMNIFRKIPGLSKVQGKLPISFSIEELRITVEKKQSPEDRRNNALIELKKRLQAAQETAIEEVNNLAKEANAQIGDLEALAKQLSENTHINNEVAARYIKTISDVKTKLSESNVNTNALFKVKNDIQSQYDFRFEYHAMWVAKAENFEETGNEFYRITERWHRIGGGWKASPIAKEFSDQLEKIKKMVADNIAIEGGKNQTEDLVEEYQDKLYWHFMSVWESNQTESGRLYLLAFGKLKGMFTAIRDRFAERVSESRDELNPAIARYNASKTELGATIKASFGIKILVLTELNKITDGEIIKTNELYFDHKFETGAPLSPGTNSALTMVVDIKLNFMLGEQKFNLVNLHWKSQLTGYNAEESIIEQLPCLIFKYLFNNLFDLIISATGSIKGAIELIWKEITGKKSLAFQVNEQEKLALEDDMFNMFSGLKDGNALEIAKEVFKQSQSNKP